MIDDRAGEIARFLAQPALARLLSALDGDGEETRVVGGAVRNLLLGEPASDIDLATTALPQGAKAAMAPSESKLQHAISWAQQQYQRGDFGQGEDALAKLRAEVDAARRKYAEE